MKCYLFTHILFIVCFGIPHFVFKVHNIICFQILHILSHSALLISPSFSLFLHFIRNPRVRKGNWHWSRQWAGAPVAGQGGHRCPSASWVETLVSAVREAEKWSYTRMATHRKQQADWLNETTWLNNGLFSIYSMIPYFKWCDFTVILYKRCWRSLVILCEAPKLQAVQSCKFDLSVCDSNVA